MDSVSIKLNDAASFDNAVHGKDGVRTLQDGSDLAVITKDGAMDSGRAAAVLTFSVNVDGKVCRAQTVVSVRLMHSIGAALSGRYDEEGFSRLK